MNIDDTRLNIKNKGTEFIKNKIFDIIAVGIIVAMTVLSLGIIELREINWLELANVVIECIPFYFSATMLSINYYNKGCFAGKSTSKFIDATKYYSERVDLLTGEHISKMYQFCTYYNSCTLKSIQETLLRSVALTWEQYDTGVDNKAPLKTLTKKELKSLYNKEIVKVIIKCKKLKVKGIHPNILLSTNANFDNTDLGNNEKDLHNQRFAKYAISYIVSIFAISLIAVKDVLQWGWMGAFLTLFKVLYIACGACMKYFNGYDDITVEVVNHIYRKTDVLKEFEYWYNSNFNNVVTTNVKPE